MAEFPPELTQGNLQQIANELPPQKWKPLGRVLGLPCRDLDNIAASQPHDPVEQRYQMLQLWCSQNEDASWDKLADALCSDEVGCSYLARKFQVRECKSGVFVHAHVFCLSFPCKCSCTVIHVRICVADTQFHS